MTVVQYSCEIARDFSDLEAVEQDWSKLWHSSDRPEIFQSFAWVRAFWQTYASEYHLWTPIVRREEEIVGILPLVRSVRSRGVLRFLGSPWSDYNDIICERAFAREAIEVAFQHMLSSSNEWTICVLDNVRSESNLAQALPALHPALRRRIANNFKCSCPYAALSPERSAKMAKKQSLRRHEKKLEKHGPVTFEYVEDTAEVLEHLESLLEYMRRRRALVGKQSAFQIGRDREFLRALVKELDPRRTLRFAVLRSTDRAVAYQIGFQLANRLSVYQLAFDIDYWDCGPGEVLLRKLLLDANREHVQELDFTTGDELYKDRFATGCRQNGIIHFSRRVDIQWALTLLEQRIRGVSRRIRERARRINWLHRLAKFTVVGVRRRLQLERQLARNVGSPKYSLDVTRRLFRHWVFEWKTNALVFLHSQNRGEGFEERRRAIQKASLSDLLQVASSNLIIEAQLPQLQRKMKSGERLFLEKQCSELKRIWSLKQRSDLATKFGAAVPIIYAQCYWEMQNGESRRAIPYELLREASRDGNALLCCELKWVRDRICQMQPRAKYTEIRLFHWWRIGFVSDVREQQIRFESSDVKAS